jgi:hypothetical protein
MVPLACFLAPRIRRQLLERAGYLILLLVLLLFLFFS